MTASRYAKILKTFAPAAFASLVTLNNITNYGSNFEFVKHVFSMDTTFPSNNAMYRATETPAAWNLGYRGIIASEGRTCLLLLTGALKMWAARHACGSAFDTAKNS